MQPIGLCLISLKIIVSCSSIPTLTTFKALDKLVETYDSYNDYYEHDHDHSDLYDHDDNHSDLNNTNYDHSDLYHPINDRVNSGDDIENPSDSDQLQSDADSEDNAKNKRDRYSKNTKLGCKSNGTPGPPEFDESIVKLVLISGANLGSRHDLNCPYRGCPKPLIKWIKDGKEVKRRSYVMGQSEISINRRRGRLSIMNNRRPDDGFYTCIISNEYGSINHTIQVKSVEVRLNQKPEIKEPLENSTLLVGSNHTLVCEPLTRDNVQAKRITWWRHYQVDGSYTNSEGMAYCTELETFMETRLDLLNLQTNDSTYYSCSIENHFGSTLSTAFINVVETLDKDHENRNGWYLVAAVGITVLAFIFFFIGLLIYFRRRYKDKLDTVTHKLDTATHKLDTVKMHVTQVKTLIVSKGDSLEPIITSIKERQEHEGDAANFESEYKFPEDPLWEFPRHLLSFDKPLGEGNFGCVKLASAIGEIRDGRLVTHQDPTSQSKRVMVAVKMVKESNNDEDVTGLLREAEIMKVIGRHQNIINLIGVCSQPVGSHLLVLVEFAKYGNLKEFLTKRKPGTLELLKERSQGRELHKPVTDDEIGPVSLKMMLSFGVQVAKGMEFLSNRRCVHRDLAARNVLVADNFTLKVADFGLARDVQEKDYYRKEGKGGLPLKWMAPESIQERISTTMSDVWSFGILLWEILTFGDSPYKTIQDQLTLMDFIQVSF
ncbi:fibroblast growth factor receptor 1 [Eurytemora carolleeae]|uniref:fibroblast growth factor receptor 1 n=1 Tax=Eurytemora carolleeae TaxID=1294199 RepID=UPI000C78AED1|nr:fibroblast growth factor receptor 1 [Eurytemora carolleeae]|eukprot:XP_023343224.1 fibroblast growth factor receptor 1-like [Eurytemora affinis]